MLIYITNEQVQNKIEEDFNIKVSLYQVYDTVEQIINSPLWFEMYRPDEEVESNYK